MLTGKAYRIFNTYVRTYIYNYIYIEHILYTLYKGVHNFR